MCIWMPSYHELINCVYAQYIALNFLNLDFRQYNRKKLLFFNILDAIQRTFSYTTRPSVTNRKITETRTRDMEPTLQSNNLLICCSLDHINTVVTFSVNKSSNEKKQDLPIYITPNELDCTTDEVHMREDGENVTGLFQPPLTTSDEHSYIDSEEDSFDESMHYV